MSSSSDATTNTESTNPDIFFYFLLESQFVKRRGSLAGFLFELQVFKKSEQFFVKISRIFKIGCGHLMNKKQNIMFLAVHRIQNEF